MHDAHVVAVDQSVQYGRDHVCRLYLAQRLLGPYHVAEQVPLWTMGKHYLVPINLLERM